jgi:hypothetical protein
MSYHAIQWTGSAFTATKCGAPTWSGEGLSTTNRARVTCADCLALLAPEPVEQTMPAPAKVMRKKADIAKPQTGFNFGGAL